MINRNFFKASHMRAIKAQLITQSLKSFLKYRQRGGPYDAGRPVREAIRIWPPPPSIVARRIGDAVVFSGLRACYPAPINLNFWKLGEKPMNQVNPSDETNQSNQMPFLPSCRDSVPEQDLRQ